ncbi:MAG: hypothetical protein JSR19_04395 [Proteobacteria bacterium]|nr:hypothetical protein [Pseudomonadota bacterium]HQR05104.1 hypothetical protein [Rhodocyclaceae bacterium]
MVNANSLRDDQAAGLRRLFGHQDARTVAFMAAEPCGLGALLARTAYVLAAGGREVILVDERVGSASLISAFGATPGQEVYDVLLGDCSLDRALIPVAPLIRLLGAHRAASALVPGEDGPGNALPSMFQRLTCEADFVLVDALSRRDAVVSAVSRQARHWVVATPARPESVTRAYALIKRIAREQGRTRFHLTVTGARRPEDARAIFGNMRQVAADHLGVDLKALPMEMDHLAGSLLNDMKAEARTAPPDRQGRAAAGLELLHSMV